MGSLAEWRGASQPCITQSLVGTPNNAPTQSPRCNDLPKLGGKLPALKYPACGVMGGFSFFWGGGGRRQKEKCKDDREKTCLHTHRNLHQLQQGEPQQTEVGRGKRDREIGKRRVF